MKLRFLPLLIAAFFLWTSCNNSSEKQSNNSDNTSSNKINIDSLHALLKTRPTDAYYVENGFDIISEAKGDLNKDNIDERAVLYKSKDDYMYYLAVFKNIDNQWHIWFKNDKRSFSTFKGMKIQNGVLYFSFTSLSSVITDEYMLDNQEFILTALHIDYQYKCSTMSYNHNFISEDFAYKRSMGCGKVHTLTEQGKKRREEHITFENRRFTGHAWRTPKGQILEF